MNTITYEAKLHKNKLSAVKTSLYVLQSSVPSSMSSGEKDSLYIYIKKKLKKTDIQHVLTLKDYLSFLHFEKSMFNLLGRISVQCLTRILTEQK